LHNGLDPRSLRRDYGDIRAEARSCRSTAALFDFSFMHRIIVRGTGAQALVQTLTPRPMADLLPGRIRYALHLDAGGRVLSDITAWRLDAETFEVFAGTADIFAILQASAGLATSVRDARGETAIFAVQGPHSLRALAQLTSATALRRLPYFAHAEASIAGVNCRIGRLGYTGERGFEIILPRHAGEKIWALLAKEAKPAGFAAADILRIEAGFPLFTNEFAFPASPAELDLERFGRSSLPTRAVRLISFQAHCDFDPVLWQPLQNALFPPAPGTLLVTSACRSIVSGEILGLGYARDDAPHLLDPSGNFQAIRQVALPFCDPQKCRPRGDWDQSLLPSGAAYSFER
jgi:glycine cleavage system T protein (aminomethyltransferase)